MLEIETLGNTIKPEDGETIVFRSEGFKCNKPNERYNEIGVGYYNKGKNAVIEPDPYCGDCEIEWETITAWWKTEPFKSAIPNK